MNKRSGVPSPRGEVEQCCVGEHGTVAYIGREGASAQHAYSEGHMLPQRSTKAFIPRPFSQEARVQPAGTPKVGRQPIGHAEAGAQIGPACV